MPRGKELTSEEKAVIVALREEGLTQREIGQRLQRSQTAIKNFLKKRNEPATNRRTGRPKKVTDRGERLIHRMASVKRMSTRQISTALDKRISHKTVHRVLKKSKHLKYQKLARRPLLSSKHKSDRLDFARNVMSWVEEWYSVAFSDEKKFNLDGPDGFSHYWHDLSRDPSIMSRGQAGGGSVMVWGAIGFNGVSSLAIIDTKLNSAGYLDILGNNLLPFKDLFGGSSLIFQQDNSPIHVSQMSKAWFESKNIRLLTWPARSPDLPPIENLWGILCKIVYDGNRQYSSRNELITAIEQAWYGLVIANFPKMSCPGKRAFPIF